MPEPGPLDILISLLERRAPLLLSGILDRILPEAGYSEFIDLVQELVPDHRTEILAAADTDARIILFASRFRDAYFPLPWFEDMWGEYTYEDVVSALPIQTVGIGYEDWHELPEWDAHSGRQLMAALIESPWNDDSRSPLLGACLEHVPQALLERIPAGCYQPGPLHRWLDGSKYSGLAQFADVIWHETGSHFIDAEGDEWPTATWDIETVTELTAHWLRAQSIVDQAYVTERWLEESPPERFAELLDFIDQQKALEVSE